MLTLISSLNPVKSHPKVLLLVYDNFLHFISQCLRNKVIFKIIAVTK